MKLAVFFSIVLLVLSHGCISDENAGVPTVELRVTKERKLETPDRLVGLDGVVSPLAFCVKDSLVITYSDNEQEDHFNLYDLNTGLFLSSFGSTEGPQAMYNPYTYWQFKSINGEDFLIIDDTEIQNYYLVNISPGLRNQDDFLQKYKFDYDKASLHRDIIVPKTFFIDNDSDFVLSGGYPNLIVKIDETENVARYKRPIISGGPLLNLSPQQNDLLLTHSMSWNQESQVYVLGFLLIDEILVFSEDLNLKTCLTFGGSRDLTQVSFDGDFPSRDNRFYVKSIKSAVNSIWIDYYPDPLQKNTGRYIVRVILDTWEVHKYDVPYDFGEFYFNNEMGKLFLIVENAMETQIFEFSID